MIRLSEEQKRKSTAPKAVGLISGGLDSTIACKIMKDLGVDVHGVFFAMPWGCCQKNDALSAAQKIGIKVVVLQLDERYLEIVRSPKFGRGAAMNPCIDCRIHMFSRAAQYMRHIEADFVFTGEVLGQRPMSQRLQSMRIIEKNAGLAGRLLRPLSAQLLEPTTMESSGLIDRNKLLGITGRGRKDQFRLAKDLGITEFSPPAGGCLLTDDNFSRRINDTFKHGYRNFRETIALKWGRHFRLNENFKAILGRDKEENESLVQYAHPDDIIMQLPNNLGPTLILKGLNPPLEILSLAAGLIQRFSKYHDQEPLTVNYWPVGDRNDVLSIQADKCLETIISQMLI